MKNYLVTIVCIDHRWEHYTLYGNSEEIDRLAEKLLNALIISNDFYESSYIHSIQIIG